MSCRLLGCGIASAMALTVSLGAQAPSQTPAKMDDHKGMAAMMVTVEGCLRPETDVPGRAVPETVQRVATADADWVLTDTKMVKGMQPQVDGSTSAVGTSGANAPALMYKVKTESKDVKFAAHKNKRVQIDGTFSHEARADNSVAFAKDMVKLNATTMREVAGDCPSNDSSKRQPEKK
jgi:hypothetical protein